MGYGWWTISNMEPIRGSTCDDGRWLEIIPEDDDECLTSPWSVDQFIQVIQCGADDDISIGASDDGAKTLKIITWDPTIITLKHQTNPKGS